MIELRLRSSLVVLGLLIGCRSGGSVPVERTGSGSPPDPTFDGGARADDTPPASLSSEPPSHAEAGVNLPGVLLDAQIVSDQILGPLTLGPQQTALHVPFDNVHHVRQVNRYGHTEFDFELPNGSWQVLAGPDDTFFLYGSFSGQLALGSHSVTSTANPPVQSGPAESYAIEERDPYGDDGFIARIEATGKVRWLRTFSGAGAQSLTHAQLSGDELTLIGKFEARVLSGALELRSRFGARSGASFMARANLDGEVTQLSAFDAARMERVVFCADGHVVVSGQTLDTDSGRSLRAIGADGATSWTKSWPASGIDVAALQCDDRGSVYALLRADETPEHIVVYGEHLSKESAIVRIDAKGAASFLARIPGTQYQPTLALKSDRIAVAGSFTDTIDFGEGSTSSRGNTDVLLAEFDLEGELVWGTTWGGAEDDAGFALYPTDDGWLMAFYTGTPMQLGTPAVDLRANT